MAVKNSHLYFHEWSFKRNKPLPVYCHIQIKLANDTTYSRNKLENTTPTNNFVIYVYSIQQLSKTKKEKIALLYPPLLYVLFFQELLKTPVEYFNISYLVCCCFFVVAVFFLFFFFLVFVACLFVVFCLFFIVLLLFFCLFFVAFCFCFYLKVFILCLFLLCFVSGAGVVVVL